MIEHEKFTLLVQEKIVSARDLKLSYAIVLYIVAYNLFILPNDVLENWTRLTSRQKKIWITG